MTWSNHDVRYSPKSGQCPTAFMSTRASQGRIVIVGPFLPSPKTRRRCSSRISSAMPVRDSRTSSANGAFGRHARQRPRRGDGRACAGQSRSWCGRPGTSPTQHWWNDGAWPVIRYWQPSASAVWPPVKSPVQTSSGLLVQRCDDPAVDVGGGGNRRTRQHSQMRRRPIVGDGGIRARPDCRSSRIGNKRAAAPPAAQRVKIRGGQFGSGPSAGRLSFPPRALDRARRARLRKIGASERLWTRF
jgi:hypothetical protein